jgi:hypothetical protein
MKVLAIMVDVTNLTKGDIEDLQYAMEVQCENANTKDDSDATILSSKVKDILATNEEEH